MPRIPLRSAAGALAIALGLFSSAARADSGVDPSRISLPKGPGSIEGLGRNFEPSPASGTASYGIDIQAPVSVAGFAPKLALEYDGGGGVSEVGLGWRLSGAPAIKRRVADGLPLFDASDRFELSGLGGAELVEVEPDIFRSRFETGTFARVTRSGQRWEARTKEGITYRFGGEGYVEAEGDRIATYLLSEQLDRHGHSIRYEWDTEDGRALLTRVAWNETAPSAVMEVVLLYEERPDVHEIYSSGIRQRIERRLSEIRVTVGGEPFRRYELGYEPGERSLLSSVRSVGADDETALPAVSFGYTALDESPELVAMESGPGYSPADPDVTLADLDGDSLPDLLVGKAGAFRSYLNEDGVTFASGVDWAASASPSVSLGTQGVQLADLDADGAIDLIVKSGETSFRYLPALSATGLGAPVSIATVPAFTFEDPEVRLADVDADRRIDVMVTTPAGLAVSYNVGGTDFTEPTIVGEVDPDEPLLFSAGAALCDVNGDSLQDFCKLRSGSLQYWLGRGRGSFQAARAGDGVPSYTDNAPYLLLDLDGDGWADLVRVGVSGVDYALAAGIGRFGEVRRIEGTPEKTSTTAVEFADMNGSGTTDIVWIDPTSATGWQYMELFPAGRAGLLSDIDNGLGKRSLIEYGTAAQHAARSRANGEPWATRMNGGMAVVQRVTVSAGLGDPPQVTEFDYRDGAWDPVEHTFAGFAAATQHDAGDDYAAARLTAFTYDVGLSHRALRGQTLSSEGRDETSGLSLRRTTNDYRILEVAEGSEYAYKSSERIELIEGLDPSESRTVLTEWEHDEHGNVTAELRWGEVMGDDKLAGGDEALTHRTFAESEDDWLLGRVATEELSDASGSSVSIKRSYYDGEPLVGLELGQISRGDLTRTESWIEGERFADEERLERDAHGNVVVVLDARGQRSEIEYDAESSTFVVSERRILGPGSHIVWTADYDRVLGLVTEAKGPNGEEYSFRYDGLGRVTSIVEPGDSLEQPTREFAYELDSPLSRIQTFEREAAGEDGAIEKLAFYDGLGRLRGNVEEGASDGQWVASSVVSYDARGNVAFTANSSNETSSELPALAPDGITTRRDALGRTVLLEQADGASKMTLYLPLGREEWDENDGDSASPHHETPTRRLEDGLGRLRQVVERDGARELVSAVYEYDAAGKLVRSTDAAGKERRYVRDGRGRQRRVVDPNAGTWEFTYTDGNDVESRQDPVGNIVRHLYDALGRPVEEWHTPSGGDEALVVTRHYDEAAAEHPDAENLVGQLAWVEDAAGSVYFGYSPRGLETEKIRRWPDGSEHRVASSYDSAGRRVTREFPGGSYYAQTYDGRGLAASLGPIVTSVEWTAWGRPEAIHLGNGVVDQRHHDERMRLVRLEAHHGSDDSPRDLSYVLDPSSRVERIDDLRPGVGLGESLSAAFSYDDRYRLRSSADDDGNTTTWDVDDVGNVLSVRSDLDDPALNIDNYFEDAGGPDRLTSRGDEPISYDDAGRVVADGSRTLQWDAKGRLTSVTSGALNEEYVYGYDDTRALKRSRAGQQTSETRYIAEDVELRDGKLVRYVFFDGQRVARLDSMTEARPALTPTPPRVPTPLGLLAVLAGLLVALVRRVRVPALASCGLVLAMVSCGSDPEPRRPDARELLPAAGEITEVPASAVFYLTDIAGTVTATLDASGNSLSSVTRHPYGSVRHASGPSERHGFIGKETDEAGFMDFGARPYLAEANVFVAPDPVSLFEADTLIGNPAKLSAYGYASSDPINFVDPTGRMPEAAQDDIARGVHYRDDTRPFDSDNPSPLLSYDEMARKVETEHMNATDGKTLSERWGRPGPASRGPLVEQDTSPQKPGLNVWDNEHNPNPRTLWVKKEPIKLASTGPDNRSFLEKAATAYPQSGKAGSIVRFVVGKTWATIQRAVESKEAPEPQPTGFTGTRS